MVSQAGRFSTSDTSLRDSRSQPFLHRVVGLVHRAEHPVGHGTQVRPLLLERRCQLLLVHVVHLRHHARSTYGAARM